MKLLNLFKLFVSSFFLTATWLPHRQLRATVKGAASLTQRLLLCLFFEKQEPCSKTESQSLAESPVGFETGSFQFSVCYLITIGLPACLPAYLVIRQRSKSQNKCYKKTKHSKFSKKQIFLTPCMHTNALF